MVGDGLNKGWATAELRVAATELIVSSSIRVANCWRVPPQQGATRGRPSADPTKIDNEIIDSIFRMNSGGGHDNRWEIGDITSGYETYTSFEGGVTMGGAAKFTINANTGYPMVQTDFGPSLIEGKGATFWECMLRKLTSSLLHFEEKTRAEKIISSYVRKSNTAWLQLYAFLCAQTGCLITGRLPGAKAINALIQAEKNPDNAPARLIRIINQQESKSINGTMIRDMMIQKKSFLVLDWPMRAVNAKGCTKTFQMMVNEQGWTNIEERSRIERAGLIEFGHDEYHLTATAVGKDFPRSTEAGRRCRCSTTGCT